MVPCIWWCGKITQFLPHDVPAELVEGVICACIREICFFRDFMELKRQKLSWSFLAWHLYTRPQTGSLTYFSAAVRNGTKKKSDQFSRSKFSIPQPAGCCFCCTSMQGQTMLKVYATLRLIARITSAVQASFLP